MGKHFFKMENLYNIDEKGGNSHTPLVETPWWEFSSIRINTPVNTIPYLKSIIWEYYTLCIKIVCSRMLTAAFAHNNNKKTKQFNVHQQCNEIILNKTVKKKRVNLMYYNGKKVYKTLISTNSKFQKNMSGMLKASLHPHGCLCSKPPWESRVKLLGW